MPQIELVHGEKREAVEVEEGTSLHDFMVSRYPEEQNFPVPTLAIFEGKPVLRETWKKIKLYKDDVAIFSALPMGGGGGGSNPIATILQAVVMIIGAIVSCIPGFQLVGALIIMAGSMLIGMLFKNKPKSAGHMQPIQNEASSPTYSLNASSNAARLNQPLGEVFGKIQVLADVVAQPYSIYKNNNMYLYQVFGLGRGECEHHQFSFGDNVIWKDGNLVPGAYVFDDDSSTVSMTVALPFDTWTDPISIAPSSTPIRNFSITIRFPDGLCSYYFVDGHEYQVMDPDSGQWKDQWERGYFVIASNTFKCSMQIRELSSTGELLTDWIDLQDAQYSATTESATSFTIQCTEQEHYGSFEVRIKNTSTPIGTITAMETPPPAPSWPPRPPSPPIERTAQARETAEANQLTYSSSSVQLEIVLPGNPLALFPDKWFLDELNCGKDFEDQFIKEIQEETPHITPENIIREFTPDEAELLYAEYCFRSALKIKIELLKAQGDVPGLIPGAMFSLVTTRLVDIALPLLIASLVAEEPSILKAIGSDNLFLSIGLYNDALCFVLLTKGQKERGRNDGVSSTLRTDTEDYLKNMTNSFDLTRWNPTDDSVQ